MLPCLPPPSPSSSCVLSPSSVVSLPSHVPPPPLPPLPPSLLSTHSSPFSTLVYSATRSIPKGFITTYSFIHRYIGRRGCPQAIGQALKRNPYPPEVVPCHRVVNSDLSLGGYGGHVTGDKLNNKIALLRKEGVIIVQGLANRQKRSRQKMGQVILRCSGDFHEGAGQRVLKECLYTFGFV
eukprot:GHVS01051647.1.p1 GENE.GHVS01051647.1~~GHVS01051647.1.p1  ORF type:complete len:181 (-),score=42.65 GHVS01051647.1:63-605(-)